MRQSLDTIALDNAGYMHRSAMHQIQFLRIVCRVDDPPACREIALQQRWHRDAFQARARVLGITAALLD